MSLLKTMIYFDPKRKTNSRQLMIIIFIWMKLKGKKFISGAMNILLLSYSLFFLLFKRGNGKIIIIKLFFFSFSFVCLQHSFNFLHCHSNSQGYNRSYWFHRFFLLQSRHWRFHTVVEQVDCHGRYVRRQFILDEHQYLFHFYRFSHCLHQ